MAGNGTCMTYDNLTEVPATSSLVRLIFLSAPLSIYHVHAGWWWCSLLLVQSDRGLLTGSPVICGGRSLCCIMTERESQASSLIIAVS